MKGIRRDDLQPCGICGKGIAHDGSLAAYRITIEQFAMDPREVQKMAGLEMMLGGSAAIAHVMGPDPEFYKGVSSVGSLVCQTCFLNIDLSVAQAWESIGEAASKREEAQVG